MVFDGRLHVASSLSLDFESIGDAPSGAYDLEAVWSPDGDRIASSREFGAEHELRVFDVADERDIVVSTTHGDQLDWSPDGRRIAFRAWSQRSDGAYEYELSVVDADGAAEVQLTRTMDVTEWKPRWSPDGRWIAVGVHTGIALFSAEGVAGPVLAVPAGTFAWSMASDRLLVSNNSGLQFVEVESGSVHPVGDADALAEFAWSEAHDRIAFTLVRHDSPDGKLACDIFTTREQDPEVRLLVRGDLGFCYHALQWSQDGERLLLDRGPWHGPGHEDDEDAPKEIRIVRADGSDLRLLARSNDPAHSWLEAQWRPVSAEGET